MAAVVRGIRDVVIELAQRSDRPEFNAAGRRALRLDNRK
jgi:hypothetical protein